MKKLLIFWCIVFIVCGCSENNKNQEEFLEVHFLKLDSGKCTLFKLPNNGCIIVDCGTSEDFPKLCEYLRELHVCSVDGLFVTYTDSLHMGGAKKILQSFDVNELYIPKTAINVQMYKNTVAEAANMKCAVKNLCCGMTVMHENRLLVSVVSPIENIYDNISDYAVSLMISYGNNTIFVEGDCTTSSENDMIKSFGDYMNSDILALSSSGSDIASSPAFLQKISPKYAVIQTFGYEKNEPSKKVLESLRLLDSEILRTDINGNVILKCDGNSINVHTDL